MAETFIMNDERRIEVVTNILDLNKVMGKYVSLPWRKAEGFQTFHELCTVLTYHQELANRVHIYEHYGSGMLKRGDYADAAHWGLRKKFEGDENGLHSIIIEGIDAPTYEGKFPASAIFHYKEKGYSGEKDWMKDITEDDREVFDRWLLYAQRELMMDNVKTNVVM